MDNINILVFEALSAENKKHLKNASIMAGIGGAIGGVRGAYSGLTKKTQLEDRINHWKARLNKAKTPEERKQAEEKLKYWKKVHNSKKFKGFTGRVSGGIGAGAASGAGLYGANLIYKKYMN